MIAPTRRQTMQWVAGAISAAAMPKSAGFSAPAPVVGNVPKGYSTDPDLQKIYKPGDVWPLTFNDAQKKAATALADAIIPEDKLGPAASDIGAVEMVDEWISSPYPETQADRPVILEGLAWLDAESKKRFGAKAFADITDDQRTAICDDICYKPKAKDEFKTPAEFFSRFRNLVAAAYYSTPQGWKAVGYIGNVQLASFEGPPKKVLDILGVEQTVK
jgi:hypothetical protein